MRNLRSAFKKDEVGLHSIWNGQRNVHSLNVNKKYAAWTIETVENANFLNGTIRAGCESLPSELAYQ